MPPEAARETIAAAIQGAMPDADDVFVHQHAVALVRALQQMNERQQAQ
jgi:hypothetical protein